MIWYWWTPHPTPHTPRWSLYISCLTGCFCRMYFICYWFIPVVQTSIFNSQLCSLHQRLVTLYLGGVLSTRWWPIKEVPNSSLLFTDSGHLMQSSANILWSLCSGQINPGSDTTPGRLDWGNLNNWFPLIFVLMTSVVSWHVNELKAPCCL